jgi:hypothetical protein
MNFFSRDFYLIYFIFYESSYIQMRFKLGISAKQAHSQLKIIDEDALTI